MASEKTPKAPAPAKTLREFFPQWPGAVVTLPDKTVIKAGDSGSVLTDDPATIAALEQSSVFKEKKNVTVNHEKGAGRNVVL